MFSVDRLVFLRRPNIAALQQTLDGFVRHVKKGLLEGVSIESQARIDVVSAILEQAQVLPDTKEVHAAAPAVLIGAALEEFLRNWVEEAGLKLGNRRPSIDAYSGLLKEAELSTRQDAKDITSWGGIRNDAAHGRWAEVEDKKRIRDIPFPGLTPICCALVSDL